MNDANEHTVMLPISLQIDRTSIRHSAYSLKVHCMIVFVCNSSGTKEVSIKESDCSSVLGAIVKYLNEGQLNTCADDIDRTMSADNGPALIYLINETNLYRYM